MPRVSTRVDLDQATTMDGCEDASARYIPRVRATTRAMIGRPDPRGPIFPPSPLSRPSSAFSSFPSLLTPPPPSSHDSIPINNIILAA
jgi:hypothetical protein